MNIDVIPFHSLPTNEFFILEKIETSDESNYTGYHRHHFYEILWFTAVGKEEKHSIDFEDYAISTNQIYILTPNQVHTMEIGTKKGFLIAVSPDFFNRFFHLSKFLLVSPYFAVQTLSEGVSQDLERIMYLIEKEYRGSKRPNLLEAYLAAFFIHIATGITQLGSKDTKVSQVLELIEKNFVEQKEVAFYANAISLSIRRTNEIVVASTGMTVKQLIINRSITEAKRYIAYNTMSLKEISYQLGFSDPAYFSRIFKQKTGITPEQFRDLKK
ncbi:helix-turn-helix domain-containing protein [Pontibacter sp. 13R65]|uniref:helix-turn-helix domain-containing protein n=1 Tax=Pontibacter sp. 13R65 TaxID=3127458 RepID=UPI00301BF93B